MEDNRYSASASKGTLFSDLQAGDVPSEPQGTLFSDLQKLPSTTVDERARQQESWWQDPLQASRMVLDGLTFGWSDELGSHVAAVALKATGQAPDVPYSELYSELQGQVQQEMNEYRKENPVASTLLSVGGGIPTAFASLPSRTVSGVSNAAKSLMTGRSASSLTAPASSTAATVGKTLGTGAALGAVGGAGTAEQGEKLEGAAIGGSIGLAGAGLFGGAGWLWNKSSSRKIVQDLGKGEDFVPISIAADPGAGQEAFIAGVYKDVISPSFGAYGKIAPQEARIINPVKLAASKASEKLAKVKQNSTQAVAEVKRKTKQAFVENKSGLKDQIKQVVESKKDAESLINTRFVTDKTQKAAEAAQVLDKLNNEALTTFRAAAVRSSIPTGTSKKVVEEIANAPTPNAAMRLIDKAWVDNGFKMIKDRKFQIQPSSISAKIEKRLSDFPFAKASVKKELDNVTEFLEDRVAKGWIDGEDLSAIRSRLGTLASSSSDAGGESAIQFAIYKEMQSILNDEIKSKLSGKALQAFNQQTEQWGATSLLRNSVLNASKKAGNIGEFTPDDWVSSIAKFSPRQARQGLGVLRKEADDAANIIKTNAKAMEEAADTGVRSSTEFKAEALKSAQNKANSEIKRLQGQLKSLERKQGGGYTAELRKAENKQRIAYLQEEADKLGSALNTLTTNASHQGSTIFTRLAATGVLGKGFATLDLITGTAIGRGLASQTGQRLVAGQTPLQAGMQSAYRGASQAAGGNLAGNLSGLTSYGVLQNQQGQ